MMFREHAPSERLHRARTAGFDGVEIQRLDEWPGDSLAEAVRESGISVALLNVEMGDLVSGGPGLSGVPGRESEFRLVFARALDLAIEVGADSLHLGPSRIPSGEPADRCLESYRRNAAFAADAAAGTSVELVIEPMNRIDYPDVLIGDLDTAVALAAEFNIGVLFDVYHAAMNGVDPAAAFLTFRTSIAHIQFADAPGRGPPGSGTIDFDAFLNAVAASDYRGWVGAEYQPPEPTETTLGWLAERRRELRV